MVLLFGGLAVLWGILPSPFSSETSGTARLVVGGGLLLGAWLLGSFAVREGLKWLAYWRGDYDPFSGVPEYGRGTSRADRRRRRREISRDFGMGPTAGWAESAPALGQGFIFLGREKGSLDPVGIGTEKHFVTIGQPGSGKSTGAVIPNLCFYEGSCLCIDPKGELAIITAARRGQGGNGVRGMGQDVHILDPFGVSGLGGAAYNVFDEMAAVAARDADRPVSYAGKIAEALIKPSSAKDPYWDNAARTLLRGLILYVFQGPEEGRNLVHLRRLLMEGDVAAWESLDPDAQDKANAFEVLFEQMKQVSPGPYRDTIAAAGASMMVMGSNQMGSVLTTTQEHTTFLDAPEIRRVSMRSDFLLEDLKEKKVTVYLCLPINMVSGKEGRWLRMFVVLFIDMMMRTRKPPASPVLLMIDEFPALGRIDGIEVVAPTMRSYGARFWAVGQDIAQFKAVYPDCWSGFIGGAEAVQFMGLTHPETVEFISKLLGRHQVKSRQGEGNQQRTVIEDRPLLDPEQVARFLAPDLKNQIIWRGSRLPLRLLVTPYFEYLPAWYYSPDPHFREAEKRSRFRNQAQPATAERVPPPVPADVSDDGDDDDFSESPGEAERVKSEDEKFNEQHNEWREEEEARLQWLNSPERRVLSREDVLDLPRLMAAGSDRDAMYRVLALRHDPSMHAMLTGRGYVAPTQWQDWLRKLQSSDDPAADFREGLGREIAARDEWRDAIEAEYGRKPSGVGWYEWLRERVFEKRADDAIAKISDEPRRREADAPGGWFDQLRTQAPATEPPPYTPPQRAPEPMRPAMPPGEMDFPELAGVIGLETVKEQIRETFNLVQLAKERAARGLPAIEITHHMVFTGNPGTGKTMMARIVGRIYKRMGLLRSGHMVEADRSKMVARYAGQTAAATKALIETALDGVLFIDEAYSLVPESESHDSYGEEAIAALIKEMEDNRGRLVVIAAGYKKEMARFIESNPGLESRFKTVIEFPDYTTGELVEIFETKVREAQCRMSLDAAAKVSDLMGEVKKGKGFGNARVVRNLLEKCFARQAKRLAHGGTVDVTVFEADDIPSIEDVKRFGMK